MNLDLSGILQIAIPVRDIDRATAFYRDVLDLRFLMNGPNMAFFDCGGVRLYLAGGEESQAGAAPAIYFRTGNIDQQFVALKKRNVSIHKEPFVLAKLPDHALWLMWFRDSEDNLFAIMEERK
jgi:catechol 2,3-dioxygenase-like lactoylglutathione lyase family enzyme